MSREKNIVELEKVDYVEYAVANLRDASSLYDRAGFGCIGERTENGRKSKLYGQGEIRIVLSESTNEKDPVHAFVQKHGDGVIYLGYLVKNSEDSLKKACQLGAPKAFDIETLSGRNGKVQLARTAISVFGDVKIVFNQYRDGGSLDDFFPDSPKQSITRDRAYLQCIDHVTVNVGKGRLDYWANFFTDIFGFYQVRYFDIRTGRTGLLSRAMRSPNGAVTMPFNEPTDSKSQIQEFINTLRGPGVQHIALLSSNILLSLKKLRKENFKFLSVPHTYYEEVPKRVPNVTEDLDELEKLGILVDGNEKGYLLQIFTENVVGPFFYEIIQRKGDDGFGEGNFRALFESIERDQIRRGVL